MPSDGAEQDHVAQSRMLHTPKSAPNRANSLRVRRRTATWPAHERHRYGAHGDARAQADGERKAVAAAIGALAGMAINTDGKSAPRAGC
jgi:hypothetical protein